MNFDQLKIFIAVVEHKSFTKAAEALYISHSTTSRSVASLEEAFGVRLLVRDNRSVRLTPAGEILFREGEKLLSKVGTIEGSVKNAGLGLSGKLTVVTIDIYSHELHSAYRSFCRRYPDVVLGMYRRSISDVWTQVNSGEADVGVTFSYALPEDLAEIESTVISGESFCVVAPVEHPLASQRSVRLADLRGVSFIPLDEENFDYVRRLDEREHYLDGVNILPAVPTLESLFLQVRSGNGVSIVPRPLAYEYGANCAVLSIENTDTSFDTVVIWRRDNLNPTLPLFADAVAASINPG